MSLNVLVMSPLHQSGASSFACILAQSLTYSNKTTTLLYTSTRSPIPKYLGVSSVEDPTRSIMQVARLIDNNAIRDKDILDYASQYVKNSYLLCLGDDTLPERDALQIIQHVYRRVPTDICIVDNEDDIGSPVTSKLLNRSDVVFVVINPSNKDYGRLHYWLKETQLSEMDNVYVVINYYDPIIDSVRNIAKTIGLPANTVCTLHYNAWIRKCCLTGTLPTVVPQVKGGDPRVLNIAQDLTGYAQVINSTIIKNARIGT